jgi:hypothetical protein
MWVVIYSPTDRIWTVGHYDPQGNWHALQDCDTSVEAARFIHYLHGGQLTDPHPDDK